MTFMRPLYALITATLLLPATAFAQDEAPSTESPPAAAAAAAETGSDSDPASAEDEADVDGGSAADVAEAETTDDDSLVVEGGSLFESALAEEAASPDGSAASYQLSGYVRGDTFFGWVPETNDPVMRAAYGEAALKLRLPGNEFGDGYAEVRFRQGIQGSERQLITDLREAYVNAYLGPFDVRLGQQIIVWGRAHAFNPTNNLTPMDLKVRSPIDDDRRMANFGARANLAFQPVRLEAVWLPLFRGTRLPDVPLPQYVSETDPTIPRPLLAESLIAGRLHLELPAFEMSVSVLNGYAPLPGVALRSYTVAVPPPDLGIVVNRAPYRHTVVGFDFSTSLDAWGVRAEAAYRAPENYKDLVNAPRPDLQYVLGVDRSFGDLSVIAQYMGRYTFDWQEDKHGTRSPEDLEGLRDTDVGREIARTAIEQEIRAVNQMLYSQLAELQHLAMLRLELPFLHEALVVSALGLVNVTTKEWLAMPKVSYKLSDALSFTAGAEYYTGPDGTGFGTIGELYSAGYSELRYTF